jgi:hypothetical protein
VVKVVGVTARISSGILGITVAGTAIMARHLAEGIVGFGSGLTGDSSMSITSMPGGGAETGI